MIKFAVVGCGHIGKRHMDMIEKSKGAELVALCDTNSNEVSSSLPSYESLEDLLKAHPEVDIVSVCTPNHLHASQALKCIEADKHVLIEKPMALHKADCEEIIHRALDRHKQVFCVMQNRFSPPSQWLKSVIADQLLGQIFMVQVNCFWNRGDDYYRKSNWKGKKLEDGGVLFTQFSHFIDVMYWLFGDIRDIQGTSANFVHKHNTEFIDSGHLSFQFKSGPMGSLSFSTAVHDRNFESSITILGEKGTVKVGGQYMNEVEYCEIENYEMPELAPVNAANAYGKYRGSAANHAQIIENVVATIGGDSRIKTNAMDGMKVVDIIERMHLALGE